MMNKKIISLVILGMFLLTGFSAYSVLGAKKINDDQNQKICISNNNQYSNTIYDVPFNKDNVDAVTRWCFEDSLRNYDVDRNVYIDNISTVDGIDDFEDGRLDTPMPWYGDTDELSIDHNGQVYGTYSAKLHAKKSYKEVKRDFETPLTGDGTIVRASIKIDRQDPDWRIGHVSVVLDEYEGPGSHEILCVRFMENRGIYEYQDLNNKIFDYWLIGVIYDIIIELDFTHQTANITVEFEWNGNPPDKPSKPSGPTNGTAGVEYTYTTSTTDPDGDQFYYTWDWGLSEGHQSWGLGPFESGEIAEAKYTWDYEGSYNIRVKAIDEYGAQSEWSDPLTVTMPVNYQISQQSSTPLFFQILQRLLNLR